MTTLTTDTAVHARPARSALHAPIAWIAARVAKWRSRRTLRTLDARRLRGAEMDARDMPADSARPLSRDAADELNRLSLGHRPAR